MVTQIFLAGAAIFAGPVGTMQPSDADASALAETLDIRAEFLHSAHNLVPRYDGRFPRRQFPFDYV
jgi:hypothetical protein